MCNIATMTTTNNGLVTRNKDSEDLSRLFTDHSPSVDQGVPVDWRRNNQDKCIQNS